ncbi:hypothetical protein ACCC98_11590 [Rhizobium pisi]|uniref:hypothetical protein n=1 Tax=Rhizobium pisi TaxID=574561 RepID=UPI0039B03AB3
MVKTIGAPFPEGRIVGYASRTNSRSNRGNDMKGFAATLTAARLEKALVFYMTPDARQDGAADTSESAKQRDEYETRAGKRSRNTEDGVEAW